jgi:hypothetical protein
MGASTTTNRPSDTVTASRIKPGSRRSTRTWAPSAPKATTSASASRVTSEGSGVNKVHILGRSIHQIVGEHRATSGQGNLPGLRQRQGDPGDLLMQRAQAHDATTPSRGSHLSYMGRQPQPGPQPQQLLTIDITADIPRRPIGQRDLVYLDALRLVGHIEPSSGPWPDAYTPKGNRTPRSAGRATLPGRRAARPGAANRPGAVPKPTSSCAVPPPAQDFHGAPTMRTRLASLPNVDLPDHRCRACPQQRPLMTRVERSPGPSCKRNAHRDGLSASRR